MTTLLSRGMALLLCSSFVLASSPEGFAYQTDQSAEPSGQSSVAPPPQAAQQTAEQLQQLVAPIALYPDALVAQILAASTYPAEIVEADRWMQQHTNLKGKQLADQVDQQSWDPSVKALTQFPSVLANLDKNLSWASSLGDAYVNQQKDVMDAVQVMRGRAKSSGNLKSTSQEKVTSQGQTIVIEPTNPDVVYVPQYDPWLVYGAPLGVWPGWYPFPGLYLGGPGISLQKGPRLNPIAVNLPEGPQKHNMDSPRHIARLVCIPEPSAVLTMEASRWRTLPASDRALVAAGIWEGGHVGGGHGGGGRR